MQPTSIQLSLSQAKADPSIAWARLSLLLFYFHTQHLCTKRCKRYEYVKKLTWREIDNLAQAMLGSALAWLRLS